MRLIDSRFKLGFEIVTSAETVSLERSPESDVDFERFHATMVFSREKKSSRSIN